MKFGKHHKNFETAKNNMRERERERAFTCPKKIRHPILASFPPEADMPLADNSLVHCGKSDAIFATDFVFAGK